MRFIDPAGRRVNRRDDSVGVIDHPVIFIPWPSFESVLTNQRGFWIDAGKPGQETVFAMRGQVHDGCAVACAMKRRLRPIFNAANNAVEQALSKTSLAELIRGIS